MDGESFGPCCTFNAIVSLIMPTVTHPFSILFTPPIPSSPQNQVAKNPEVKAAVLISKKPDNFIAGADIRMIDATEDKSTLKNSECCNGGGCC